MPRGIEAEARSSQLKVVLTNKLSRAYDAGIMRYGKTNYFNVRFTATGEQYAQFITLHELGHIAQGPGRHGGKMNREYFANDFAVKYLPGIQSRLMENEVVSLDFRFDAKGESK